MKKHLTLRLSFWAMNHRPAAIAVIVVAKIAIGAIGFYLGILAALEGFTLPLETKWLLAAIAAVSILAYPAKHLKKHLGRAAFYRRQKSMDGILTTLGFAVLFFVGNLTPAWVAQQESASPVSSNTPVTLSVVQKRGSDTFQKSVTAEERKEVGRKPVEKKQKIGMLKRWLISKVKARAERVVAKFTRASENSDDAGKILLSVLLVLLALGLTFLVAALSCSLSCNGQEGAATFVVVLGLAGIILGLVYGFRGIWRNEGDADVDQRHQQKREPTKTEKRPPTKIKD